MNGRPGTLRRLAGALIPGPLAIGMLLVVPAPATHAAEVTKDVTRNLVVGGGSETSDGCIRTGDGILARAETLQYFRTSWNECDPLEPGKFAYGEATPSLFQVRGNLETLRVVADVALTDLETGESLGTVHFDNTYSPTTKPSRTTNRFIKWNEVVPGVSIYHVSGTSLYADATGTGTLPTTTSFMMKNATITVQVSPR